MTLEIGDTLPAFDFAAADGQSWRTDEHRAKGVALVLILHRHLA